MLSLIIVSSAFVGMNLQLNLANAATATFGNTTVASASIAIATYKDATKFTLAESGTIQSITVYFANSGYNAKTAIFTDNNGVPGTLISQSASQRVSTTGWNTFALTQKSISTGKYWLTVLTDSKTAQGRIVYSGSEDTHVERLGAPTYSSEFASSFGTLAWHNTGLVSIYATYTPGAQATPSPSPSPTATPTPPPTPSPTPSSTISLGLYSNSACINELSSVTWGQLTRGTTKTQTIYVRNEGKNPITLAKGLTNWNPQTASSYITLNWNYTNQAVNSGSVVAVTLTLTVSSSAPTITSFTFSTVITASG